MGSCLSNGTAAGLRVVLLAAGTLLGPACAGDGAPPGASAGALVADEPAAEPAAPPAAVAEDGTVRALLLFSGHSRRQAEDALRARGGRPVVVFDEPALIVRIEPARIGGLEAALPGARVATGPVLDEAALALAPGALGFWNRRLGVTGPAARPVAVAAEPRPRFSRPAPPPPLGAPAEMPAELDARARTTLSRFLTCLAAPEGEGCLEGLVDPQSHSGLEGLLARERTVAAAQDVEPAAYGFSLRDFDGRRARYEVRRDGRPTGEIHLLLTEGAWTVAHLDP